ncbi:hypothetical protein SLS57_002603 [Botryosphaeria dothidea]
MTISVYDITIPVYIRALKNVSHLLTKAEEWCKENSKPESEILDARLAPDMLDFTFQVRMTRHMTESGILSADWHWVPYNQELEDEKSFAGLRDALQKQIVRLEGVKREDVEGGESRVCDVWTLGKPGEGVNFRFTEGLRFLNQFTIPNLWFQATTAHDICRMKGMDVGKKDFLCGGADFEY